MSPARATILTLPPEVKEMIAGKLYGNDKVNLALCCKAMLPTLCMGTVGARLNQPQGEEPLTQLTRCLSQQPHGVSHLKLFSTGNIASRGDTHNLMDLSLLSNLRKLSLDNVALSLPALQPVATRLQSLCMLHTHLEGSAEGFLGASWSALISLSMNFCRVHDDDLTGLNLPALESLDISEFTFGDQTGMLQPGQLWCPQLRSLAVDILDNSQDPEPDSAGSRTPWGGLQHLPRLATLELTYLYEFAPMDLGLPASLKHLTVQLYHSYDGVDLKWLLREAVRSGAQLRSLTCPQASASSHPEGTPWGATSAAHYRELAEQLTGLTDLTVYGGATSLLSAIGALASAPNLTRLKFGVGEGLNGFELPPICSASLKSVTGRYTLPANRVPPPRVVLHFLPGCTQLRDVHVHFDDDPPMEGVSVKICCHCISGRCIKPLRACADLDEVGIRFLPMPPSSSQGAQAYTVIFACHAAGDGQALKWGRVVVPGIL